MRRRAAPTLAVSLAVWLAVLLAVPPGPPEPAARAAGEPAVAVGEPAPAVDGSDYRWPLAGEPAVTRRFEPPARPWLPGHRGVDLAGSPGAVVRAAGPGVVFFAGPVGGRGVVSVAHGSGLRTTYQPVTATVAAGDEVAAGDPIGVLEAGHPGCRGGACLHWGLRRAAAYLDPLTLLGLGRVRLLPR